MVGKTYFGNRSSVNLLDQISKKFNNFLSVWFAENSHSFFTFAIQIALWLAQEISIDNGNYRSTDSLSQETLLSAGAFVKRIF